MKNTPMRSALTRPRRARHRGASMIEVLVAILIVSLGILALAGLLGVSSRLGKTSEFRAVAALLAADIADRMRANRPGADAGDYELTPSKLAGALPVAATCVTSTDCSAAELAAIDKAEWQARLLNSLPGGTGYVAYTAAEGAADIWVIWRDPKALSTSDDDHTADNALITDGVTQRCPTNFATTDNPSCMYFRVGL